VGRVLGDWLGPGSGLELPGSGSGRLFRSRFSLKLVLNN
jgi:hypothetical protein